MPARPRKNVLVTGASRGIGRAIAQDLARRGFRVGVHFHSNADAARETLSSLEGHSHVSLQADLGEPEEARSLVCEAIEKLGGLNVAVNNAGIYDLHAIEEVDWAAWKESWQRTLATNLLGPASVMYEAARHMIAQGGGRIINISSRGAFRGEPDAPAYGASKAGLNAASQSLARALGGRGVSVFVVAPGWVETDMALPHLEGPHGRAIRDQSPLRRAARPEEIARTVGFLADDDVEYLTGCILDANGASYLRS